MVNIFTNLLPVTGTLALQIAATTVNKAIESYSAELKKHVNGKICPLHPRKNQDISVYVERNSYVAMEITSCCCDKFSDSIQFVPKEPLLYKNLSGFSL